MSKFTPALLALSVCVAACAPAPAPVSAAADIAKIGELRAAFTSVMKAGNAEQLTNLYTADAIVLSAGRPAVSGRDAILAYNQEQMSSGALNLTITAEETKVMGDWAYDRGSFSMVITPTAGPAIKDEGKYLVLLAKQADGSWKVTREIGSSDTAFAAMMAHMAPPAAGTKPGK